MCVLVCLCECVCMQLYSVFQTSRSLSGCYIESFFLTHIQQGEKQALPDRQNPEESKNVQHEAKQQLYQGGGNSVTVQGQMMTTERKNVLTA